MFDVKRVSPLVKSTVRFGLLGGVLGLVLLLGMYYLGKHPFLTSIFFDFRILLFSVFMFFSLKEVRDYDQNGELFFWQGMVGCFLFTFTFAVVSSALLYAFATWQPEFVSSFIKLSLEQVRTFSAEDIERIGRSTYDEGIKALQMADAYYMASRYFFQSFILSFFISIIISVILRRQPKTP